MTAICTVRKLDLDDAEAWALLRQEALEAHPLAFGANIPEDPKTLVESFLTRLMSNGESAVFGAFISQAELFPDAAKQAGAFLKSLGALSLIELVERKEEVGNRVYRYRLTFKETILFGKIMLTKEGKIAGIQLQPE